MSEENAEFFDTVQVYRFDELRWNKLKLDMSTDFFELWVWNNRFGYFILF
jgi:hypothetical protein